MWQCFAAKVIEIRPTRIKGTSMRAQILKLFVVFITIGLGWGCRERAPRVQGIHVSQVRIDSTLKEDDSIRAFIAPYKQHLDNVLDTPLCYAPKALTKEDGRLNTSLGNLMADILLERANEVLSRREGPPVEMALMNHGGIRSSISRGPVTERTAYEVMPFENQLVVVALKGSTVREMVEFLIKAGVPHPVAGLRITLGPDGSLDTLLVEGKPLEPSRTYHVATSDYLLEGGDRMDFLSRHEAVFSTGYTLRNAMVDYFREADTLRATVDHRFVQAPQP
jgi:2',3'-cyclic-nucleotide 2'-phosphodiesterase (5'-nucleotidase family)